MNWQPLLKCLPGLLPRTRSVARSRIVTSRLMFAVLLLLSCNSQAKQLINYLGEARALDDADTVLYREEHQLWQQQDQQTGQWRPLRRQVNYYSADGELIAQKRNEYPGLASQPDFILMDFRQPYKEEAKRTDKGLRLTLSENGDVSRDIISDSDYPLVVDAGFDDFIRANWTTLLAGDMVPFSFASAARQSSVNFELQAQNPDASNSEPLKLTMTLNSALLSWLLDPIELEYHRQTQQLLRYRGISNIPDANGDGQQVDIRYRYFHKNSASVNTDQPQ